jgi:hypothetical protein
MTAVTADESFECQSSWSRAWMLEMCTSKIGPSKTFIASYIAIEVNEYAAGLMISASASVRADWIRSTSTASSFGLMKFGFHAVRLASEVTGGA